ncbi:MAG TPA: glycerol kinase [Chloroflexi bacterium]|jgi:glycerol kinase|nr:glycerol kinase [Chloroflexota bacterium]HAL27760.1 glycerol kinase [Chloroflexota bacterium]
MSAILALDQGTTGSTAVVFDEERRVRGSADREIVQHYPASGHVEHDPEEIFATTVAVGREALAAAGVAARDVVAIGITNQRETTVVWERTTGRPIHRAVVWQSRASAAICERLRAAGWEATVRQRTGLLIDAYFSGPKVRWILDQVPGAQARAVAGDLLCGTVESWLVWRLTGGQVHVTDVSNASRTMVFDIHRAAWDDELLAALELPRSLFPSPVRCSGVVAETEAAHFGAAIPIAGLAGDQQAALFGQTCFAAGEAKNTYGTGCFLLANTGERPRISDGGLLATIAWDIGAGLRYAMEGSAFVTGAAVQWLRDGLGIIRDAAETEALARSVPSGDGLYLVPAFTGLGAPHWDMYARGLLIGIERGTTRAHLARATLESIAFQTRDLVEAMRAAGQPIEVLRADGGGTANAFLMQLQADLLGVPVEVAAIRETTALGAALLAGLGVGIWKTTAELAARRDVAARYAPTMSADERDLRYAGWLRAVDRSRSWASPSGSAPASST